MPYTGTFTHRGSSSYLLAHVFVVLLQAMLFGHGGLTTLGVNSVVLGFIGPAITLGLWRTLKGLVYLNL